MNYNKFEICKNYGDIIKCYPNSLQFNNITCGFINNKLYCYQNSTEDIYKIIMFVFMLFILLWFLCCCNTCCNDSNSYLKNNEYKTIFKDKRKADKYDDECIIL